ncbi:unnamed protein product, partial [marine sediment metagenome]
PDDELIGVKLAEDKEHVILTTKHGKSIRFSGDPIRSLGRISFGVKGMILKAEDYLINISLVPPDTDKYLLLVTEKGYAKRTVLKKFREFSNRGGQGLKSIKITKERGPVVDVKVVSEEDQLVLISQNGIVIRVPVKEIRHTGRCTQGVRVMNLAPEDKVASVALVSSENIDLN